MNFSSFQVQEISNLMFREWLFDQFKKIANDLNVSLTSIERSLLINQVFKVVQDLKISRQSSATILCIWAVLFLNNVKEWEILIDDLHTILKVAEEKNADEEKVFKAIIYRI